MQVFNTILLRINTFNFLLKLKLNVHLCTNTEARRIDFIQERKVVVFETTKSWQCFHSFRRWLMLKME